MCEVCEAARRTWGSVESGMQVWRCCGYALHAWLQRIVRLPRAGAVPRGVREMGVHTARAACPCFRLVRRPSLGAADAAWAGSAAEVVGTPGCSRRALAQQSHAVCMVAFCPRPDT